MAVSLRKKIADINGCGYEQVFAGNGSDEVLALCTRAFVENDGSIAWFNPSYSLYPVLTEIRNVEKRPVELDDNFGWPMANGEPDTTLGGLSASIFFLTFPNAPTGTIYPLDTIREFYCHCTEWNMITTGQPFNRKEAAIYCHNLI